MSASQRFEFHASGAETATGNSGAIQIPTFSQMLVGVDVTAVSGTTPAMDIYLQGSDDGGTTWYDMPYDLQMTTAAAPADIDANETRRNINGTAAAAATGKHLAIYKEIPTDTVRLRWVISGTTPSFTFSASGVGK